MIPENGLIVKHCASLDAAVNHAIDHAQAGDTVLLSPACASFDMFQDYRHRALVFSEAVTRHISCQEAVI